MSPLGFCLFLSLSPDCPGLPGHTASRPLALPWVLLHLQTRGPDGGLQVPLGSAHEASGHRVI